MNNVLWSAVCAADYSIPHNHEEAHPAYAEGYYSVKPGQRVPENPHEEDSDSWHEWDDGQMQAVYNYMTRN